MSARLRNALNIAQKLSQIGKCTACRGATMSGMQLHSQQIIQSGSTSDKSVLGYAFPYALAGLAASLGVTGAASASSPQAERSFIAIKPDGVHRGLIAEIISRYERKGYKLVGIKILVPSKELAGSHYQEHEGKPFHPKLVNFLSSGPVIAMVWEGKEAIKYGRTIIGATNPTASSPGTIRGDLALDVGRNIIHGSDSLESAQREIALWFRPEELAEYAPALNSWVYE